MKLLNYFKKKSKSKNKIIIDQDEEYIKSTLVHVDYLTSESEDPIMYILFTFSNSYCPSAIDIINNMILERLNAVKYTQNIGYMADLSAVLFQDRNHLAHIQKS